MTVVRNRPVLWASDAEIEVMIDCELWNASDLDETVACCVWERYTVASLGFACIEFDMSLDELAVVVDNAFWPLVSAFEAVVAVCLGSSDVGVGRRVVGKLCRSRDA